MTLMSSTSAPRTLPVGLLNQMQAQQSAAQYGTMYAGLVLVMLPTLNVFRMSLYERGAYSPNETFVGLKNFQHLLKDTQFIRSMQNMICLLYTSRCV